MSNRSMSEEQFRTIAQHQSLAGVSKQRIEIAYKHLVLGIKQTVLAEEYGLTKGAVNQAVNRVWSVGPPGYEVITALVTEQQADVIRKWEQEAKKAIKGNT